MGLPIRKTSKKTRMRIKTTKPTRHLLSEVTVTTWITWITWRIDSKVSTPIYTPKTVGPCGRGTNNPILRGLTKWDDPPSTKNSNTEFWGFQFPWKVLSFLTLFKSSSSHLPRISHPNKKNIVFQPSILRCNGLVSGRVFGRSSQVS